MNAIVLEGVRRAFGGREVLRGVTATAETGKVVGLLGRNGEGKSTLMRVLLDMLAADAGRVEVLGRAPDGTGELRRLVGFVPERPSFHDFMSVGEVLALRERFFPAWDARRADGLIRTLELDLATPIRGASKGTLGKLAWVCAAAHDPALLLLDEPTSGLDALVRSDLLSQLIGELHETGKTILVSNHRMEELAGVLDEVWVLAGGVVAASHPVETLRAEARRIRGRRRPGAASVPAPGVLELAGPGPVAEWVAFDRPAAERAAASGLLEQVETEPVPIDETFRLLLQAAGGDHGRTHQ